MSATEAARTFSDLLNRVRYRGESFIVERGGTPVCRITPAGPPRFTLAELTHLLEALPQPDPGYLDAVEAVSRHQPHASAESPWES